MTITRAAKKAKMEIRREATNLLPAETALAATATTAAVGSALADGAQTD